jgi:hypothetical protein
MRRPVALYCTVPPLSLSAVGLVTTSIYQVVISNEGRWLPSSIKSCCMAVYTGEVCGVGVHINAPAKDSREPNKARDPLNVSMCLLHDRDGKKRHDTVNCYAYPVAQ